MASGIYLDHNADAPVLPEAWAAYREAAEAFGNPSSAHVAGRRARATLEDARARIAGALGAGPDEIVLTSGGTEADALAILGTTRRWNQPHVVSTDVEHPAVSRNLKHLAEQGAITLDTVAPGRSGEIDLEEISARWSANTRLVTVALAQNETGVIHPIADIATRCRAAGILVHTDAVQAIGRMTVDVRELGVDLLSLSGHKVGAVGGIGALFVRDGVELEPLLTGGGHERGLRATTENVAGAASLAAALENFVSGEDFYQQTTAARDRLEATIVAQLSEVEVVGGRLPRLGNTTCMRFAGCPGDALMMALDIGGVYVSTGSACSSGSIEPSQALLKMGFTDQEAREVVRFSLSPGTPVEELQRAAELTVCAVQKIRSSVGL